MHRSAAWRAVITAIATSTAGVLPSFLVGALAVQLRDDIGFGAGALGAIVASFFAAGALTSALLGRYTERAGPARALRLASLGAAASMAGIAVAAHEVAGLVALLAVGGAANALAQPAANLWLTRSVSPSRLGLAFGIKQSAIPAATLLGGLAVPLVALPLGWRWAFAFGAVGALVAAATVPAEVAPAEESAPAEPARAAPSAAEPEMGAASAASASAVTAASVGNAASDGGEDRSRPGAVGRQGARPGLGGRGAAGFARAPLIALAVGVGFGAAAASTLGSFLVSAAVDTGLSESGAGLLFAGSSVVGLSVRLVLGWRADRRPGGQLATVAGLLALGSAGFALLAVGGPAVFAVAAPLTFAFGWGWPGLFNLSVVRHHAEAPGAATGITQTGTYIGAVAGPLAFGAAVDGIGYAWAWTGSALVATAAAVTVLVGRRLVRAARAERAPAAVVAPARP